jgi:lipopolysaccharide assembly outer membrane protein LptD (OstA)
MAWEFTTTRADGAARLQMQAGPGATATCESITLRMAGTPVTLTTDGQKVRVRSGAGERGLRIEASADRVRGGADVLTLEGQVQARFDRKGQAPQTIKGDRVRLNLSTGNLHVEGAGALTNTAPAPVSLDFGFPVVVPPAEKEKEQPFNLFLGFSR